MAVRLTAAMAPIQNTRLKLIVTVSCVSRSVECCLNSHRGYITVKDVVQKILHSVGAGVTLAHLDCLTCSLYHRLENTHMKANTGFMFWAWTRVHVVKQDLFQLHLRILLFVSSSLLLTERKRLLKCQPAFYLLL